MAKDKWCRVYLILVCLLFLAGGGAMLYLDITSYIKPSGGSTLFSESASAGNFKFQGIAAIAVSGLKVLMALLGLVGAVWKARVFLFLFAAFLILDVMLRIGIIVLLSLACGNMYKAAGDSMRNVFPWYGNDTVKDAVDFTKAIDDFMKDNPCCGWSNIDGENFFLKSTWYKTQNAQLHALGQPQTLPVYCCTRGVATLLNADKCIRTSDMNLARAEGHIHSNNCLKIVTNRMLLIMYITLGVYAFIILLDAVSMYAAWMIISAESVIYVQEDSSESTLEY